MFTTRNRVTAPSSSYARVKTLSSASTDREDEKSLELEEVVTQQEAQPTGRGPIASPNVRLSVLSDRAQSVKDRLQQKSVVCAVLLKADGSSEEIEYRSCSKQANQLVNGRPTIVGELEDLGVIVVRSLDQSSGTLNANILPAPLCNEQFNGNYLLYRVDSQGNGMDLTLQQYESFVASTKTLTENAIKSFDPVDSQVIKTASCFSSSSKLTLTYVRSEVDKKIRDELNEKNEEYPSESEVAERVETALQSLVNDLVSSSSRMEDPDYEPEDDELEQDNSDLQVIGTIKKIYAQENGIALQDIDLVDTLYDAPQNEADSDVSGDTDDVVDDRDWRVQLIDALECVRERGRQDGQVLAEQISETFYDCNGREASLDELTDIFSRIKCELAYEAEEDLQEEIGDIDVCQVIDTSTYIVEQDLVSRAFSAFIICEDREPTVDELKDSVQKMALRFADQAVNAYISEYQE